MFELLIIHGTQRELAKQTADQIKLFFKELEKHGHPSMQCALCIGGVPIKDQLEMIKRYFICLHFLMLLFFLYNDYIVKGCSSGGRHSREVDGHAGEEDDESVHMQVAHVYLIIN